MAAFGEYMEFEHSDGYAVATDASTQLLSPLEEAAKNGGLATVVDLIKKGGLSYINHDNFLGKKSALHYAAENGHANIVKILLEAGFDVNAKIEPRSTDLRQLPESSSERDRAVHLAARMGHIKVLRTLHAHGAMFNVPGERKDWVLGGYHPIHEACSKGDDTMVRNLLQYDKSAINVMTGVGYPSLGASSTVAGVPIAPVPANFFDRQLTPLMIAAKEGHYSTVQTLILAGEPFGVSGPFPEDLYTTALHQAAKYGHVKLVRTLHYFGMDVNVRPIHREETVLNEAVTGGSIEMVNFLIENGADVHLPNRDGKTALHSAVEYEHEQIIGVLLKNGADPHVAVDGITPLWMAAKVGNCNIGKFLLEIGVEVNVPNCPLSIVETAVGYRHWRFLDMILELKPEIKDPQILNSALRQILGEGDGILGEMVGGSIECVSILLRHGATVEKLESVLKTAIKTKEYELVDILHEYAQYNDPSLLDLFVNTSALEAPSLHLRKRKRTGFV